MLVNIGGQIVDVNKQLMELDKVDCEESLYYFLQKLVSGKFVSF